jgi:hypothetical protein
MEERNIFEIWKENSEKTPFAVRRRNWSSRYYTIVVKVVVKKWPYGDAFGYSTIHGSYSNHYDYDGRWRKSRIIPCCGCYQWSLVENARINELDYQQFMKFFLSRQDTSIKPVAVDTTQLTYNLLIKGFSVDDIARERHLTLGTIYNHIGKLISQGIAIDLNRIILKEKQDRIKYAAALFTDHKLKPIKEYLGDSFTYDEIKLVLNIKLPNQEQQNPAQR